MKEANACGLHCTKINNISVNISGQEILKNVSIHVHLWTINCNYW